MIGPLRQTMTKGLASFAAWAYEVVDALGRCWFLLFATLFVGVTILDGLWWQVGLIAATRRWRRWAGLVLSIGWIVAHCWVAAAPELLCAIQDAERAFELGWRQAVGTDAFQDPMTALWRDAAMHRVPILFMNSTEAASGRRIVNSPIVLDPGLSSAISLPVTISPHSLRLSTAVLLSARFPAISPIANLGETAEDGPLHVVDGGYMDNSGTLTAAEVVEALTASAERLGLTDRIRTIAIVITDEPIAMNKQESNADRRSQSGIVSTAVGAVLSPFETLNHVRRALAKKTLRIADRPHP